MANGTSKNVSLGEFWQDLEISETFLISLEVSFFHGLYFTFFESRNFSPKSLGLGFLTRILASRRVLDFTIRHPWQCLTTRFDLSLKKLRKNNGWWKLALFCVTIPGNKKVVFGKYWLIKSSGGGGEGVLLKSITQGEGGNLVRPCWFFYVGHFSVLLHRSTRSNRLTLQDPRVTNINNFLLHTISIWNQEERSDQRICL